MEEQNLVFSYLIHRKIIDLVDNVSNGPAECIDRQG